MRPKDRSSYSSRKGPARRRPTPREGAVFFCLSILLDVFLFSCYTVFALHHRGAQFSGGVFNANVHFHCEDGSGVSSV